MRIRLDLKTSILLASCLVVGWVSAARSGSAQEVQASGPIDIRAEEQEFAQDQIIARGKVRVVYGDTTINAPKATLFRDEGGQPKLAIFVGNPKLKQGKNIINSQKLTFDIASATIIAEGQAHSEVLTNGINGEEDNTEKTEEELQKEKEKKAEDRPEKIITDSDKQIYDKNTGKFEAMGNVKVKTGDIDVNSNNLKLIYGTDNKAEAVLFTGNVVARREKNVTQADTMTYFLTTQRLQATGHVRSRVVQEKKEKAAAPAKSKTQIASAGAGKTGMFSFSEADGTSELILFSDAQDYNKQSGRVDAEGNVQVWYKDTQGKGPKVTMLCDEYGQAEKVIFTGRSQITQPGRRWIGDRITMTMEDRKVLAEGNTRAIIVQNKPQKRPSPLFNAPMPTIRSTPPQGSSRLAGSGDFSPDGRDGYLR